MELEIEFNFLKDILKSSCVFWLCWVFIAERLFSSCIELGLLVVHRLRYSGFSCWSPVLGHLCSVVAACGLSSCSSWALEHKLCSCSTQASLLHSMWDLPRPGIEPVSPTLVAYSLTLSPQGSPSIQFWTTLRPLEYMFKTIKIEPST